VEKGENTERFHRFTGRMLMVALVPLALGFGGDFYVVTWKVTSSDAFAALCTAALLLFIIGAWFGLPLFRKKK
jgi:hypothetical protein